MRHGHGRTWLDSVALAIVIGVCLWHALYAFVASSPFAYQQFLQPRVFAWVATLVDRHVAVTATWLIAWCLVALRERTRPGVRIAARVAALGGVGVAVYDLMAPVLMSLGPGRGAVSVSVASMAPCAVLAALEHADIRAVKSPGLSAIEQRATEVRAVSASWGAAALVAAIYATGAGWRLAGAFEPELGIGDSMLAVAMSFADVVSAYLLVALLLALLSRVASSRALMQYLGLVGVVTAAVAIVAHRLLTDSLGNPDAATWTVSVAATIPLVALWALRRVRTPKSDTIVIASASDTWMPRYGGAFEPWRGTAGVLVVVAIALAGAMASAKADWDFVVMRTALAIVACAALWAVARVTPPRPSLRFSWLLALCLIPVTAQWGLRWMPPSSRGFERYAVYNPLFAATRAWLHPTDATPPFDAYLRAHTGLTDVAVAPISIVHTTHSAQPGMRRPHIFLLVVDSLRPDYLSPYNPRVHFTPHIQALASEGEPVARSFTQYGGTGLSMPAIWAGSALAHKQYVTPFAPMNALEALVDRHGYQRVMSRDHITAALWTPRDGDVELDAGRAEMQFDLCRTLSELQEVMAPRGADAPPVFAQTRALNLHVAEVRRGLVPEGKSYPGFDAPYAWRVERIDGCVGSFVAFLKAKGLYDDSLVALTSDHGELLGEDGRWGHSHHMFPEVVQTPLVVHWPKSESRRVPRDRVVMSTDITPTLYDVLGYPMEPGDGLRGRSMFAHARPGDQGASAAMSRQRVDLGGPDPSVQVLAASYGAVYAVVSRGGDRLYITDAIKGIDYLYDRRPDGPWVARTVDPASRALHRWQIRRHVDAIAASYHLPEPY